MLRKIRVTLAILFFAAITMLFLDFTGTVHVWLGWMAKIQFLPAVMALNVGVVVGLIVLTLLLGRVYCSVICPLGVMQDCISWLSGKRKGKRMRFTHSPALKWIRYVMLVLFVIALVAGLGSVVALLAPYSSYGRIASNLFAPLYRLGNNVLAHYAEQFDSYAFYSTEVWLKSMPTFIIAAVTLVALIVLAWRNGRTYCNTICPIGTVLGFLSRFSIMHLTIDTNKCVNCGVCARKCKASCINPKEHRIDYSRCVACMDCIESCTHDAIHYVCRLDNSGNGRVEKMQDAHDQSVEDKSRRTFLTTSAVVAATMALKAQDKKVDGGLAVIEDKQVPKRVGRIVPAGAESVHRFAQHCTGCQLCVSACPNNVLRPSTSLKTLMQPEMSYERGYCRPECNACPLVCPAGAIKPITLAQKSSTRIGHAVWVKKNCLPLTEGVHCGNCARHCPAGAIKMVHSVEGDNESPRIPVVNVERCIGCGACENLCPARPYSAIYVEGHEMHSEK